MPARKPKQWDTVALTDAVSKPGLRPGQVGTILSVSGDNEYQVEFLDANRDILQICSLPAEAFLVLQLDTDALQKRMEAPATIRRYLSLSLLILGFVSILTGLYLVGQKAEGTALISAGRAQPGFLQIPADGSIFHVLGLLLIGIAYFLKK
ncbi:MAG: DUF4926 domain-containing protein [Saprospiraceae bacterium]|nr:DUF4926 domain-containing protein [Saprospiraceae bacterium]